MNSINLLNPGSDNFPISGGQAVYRTRSLYFIIDPDMVYDDEFTCLQSGYLYKTSKNIKQKSKLYPNPASNDINLIYNITENARLEISDQFGRVFHSHFLSKELFNFSFPVSGFENGIYNYRIVSNENNLIDVGQFIVIK